ncbi:hypothetical protein [Arthrobacter sp. PAMC 25486]|uniref:hypothetical protein n=1 Tax=Arthrobacter sp. PAMC 25486 TaxID=1494608 RepID=UPI0012FEA114|nr:hypothetical protein [Arthrobacter sp. PAMC 25486]
MDRENSDGEYDLPTYNAARVVTVTGNLQARSHMDMHEAMNFLTGPMRGRLQVSGHSSTQWADAKRNAGVKFTPITDTLATWQVPLRCPDPAKYGDRHTYDLAPNVAVSAFHRGNYAASPVVQVNGPLVGGFTITHPGGLYTALGDLGAGGWVRVDFATGRLRLNGNDRSDLVTRADLFKVLPGNNASVKISKGTGYVEVIDTYM